MLIGITTQVSKTVNLWLFIIEFIWGLNYTFKSESNVVKVHEGVIDWLCTGCSYLFSQLYIFRGACPLTQAIFMLCTTTKFSIVLL